MIHSRFWQITLVVIVVLFSAASVLPTAFFTESVRFVEIFLAMSVGLTFSTEAWRVSLKPRQNASDHLILGICFGWATLAIQGVWIQLWRLAGEPRWMVNNNYTSLFVGIVAYSAAMHLMTSSAINGDVPRRKTVLIALIVSAALMTSVVTFGLTAKVSNFLNWLQPK